MSYAIVFVSDMARGVSFYRDVIGLTLRFESPDGLVLSVSEQRT